MHHAKFDHLSVGDINMSGTVLNVLPVGRCHQQDAAPLHEGNDNARSSSVRKGDCRDRCDNRIGMRCRACG
ncbi:hypothetical protein PSP6_270235 [Paraburkholderia tropica]|nr:hypothetical protein PSP6_270235 [Paraburkholderia tropica]